MREELDDEMVCALAASNALATVRGRDLRLDSLLPSLPAFKEVDPPRKAFLGDETAIGDELCAAQPLCPLKRANQAPGPNVPGRSYFGVAWLCGCLLLAAYIGWRYSPEKIRESRRQAATASRYSYLKVEDAQPGQRLVSRNPDMAAPVGPTKVDPLTWRLVRLKAETRWPDGTLDTVEIKTLQPPEWLEEHRVEIGRLVPIPLDLVEMGLPEDMKAEVVAVEPCPKTEEGTGEVILTTVSHLNNDLYTLTLENAAGRREAVHPTGLHKLRRADGEWVSVRDLRSGDRLAGLDSEMTVVSIERLPGVHRVYNCTVENEHVYFVGELGLLAHNNGCSLKQYDIVPYRQRLPVGSGFEKHHGLLNEWAEHNLRNYVKGDAPSILLTEAQHNLTRAEFAAWRIARTGSLTGYINWRRVTNREMQDLMRRMFNAAGVPQAIQDTYMKSLNRYLYTGSF